MDVSIIIVNYNTEGLVIDCIRSICEKTDGIDYEIIVIDNNSPNGISILEKTYGNVANIVKLQENIGFGRANNEGIKIANGRNIFLLNPDTVLINNAVKILSDFLDKNAKVGVCGGNLYDEENKPTHSYMPILPGIRWEINQLLRWKLWKNWIYDRNFMYNHSGKPIKVGYITGADMMIRKDVINESGWFDKDFFMYYEETELTWRIKKLGFDVYNLPQAKIQHLEGKSFSSNLKRLERIMAGRNLYYIKTSNKVTMFIADLISISDVIINYVQHLISHNKEELISDKIKLSYLKASLGR